MRRPPNLPARNRSAGASVFGRRLASQVSPRLRPCVKRRELSEQKRSTHLPCCAIAAMETTPPDYIQIEPSSLELRFNLELNMPASQTLSIRSAIQFSQATHLKPQPLQAHSPAFHQLTQTSCAAVPPLRAFPLQHRAANTRTERQWIHGRG